MQRMRNKNQDISNKEQSTIFESKDMRKEIDKSDDYKCEICSVMFKNKESLFNHTVSAHSQVTKCCHLCQVCFENEPEFITHNLVFHDTRFIICGRGKCSLQFETDDELGAHLKEKLEARKFLFCDICDAKFRKTRSLVIHKMNEHKVGKVYICGQCAYFSDTLDDLMVHEKRQWADHNQYTLPTSQPHAIFDGNRVSCKECDKTFGFATDVVKHIKLKHGEIIGIQQPKVTANKEQQPEESEVGLSKWKCNKCEKRFKAESSRNSHIFMKHNRGIIKFKKQNLGIKKPRHKKDGKGKKSPGASNEESETKLEIKIEIKLEPCDRDKNEENLLEMIDLKTEAIYNNEWVSDTEVTLEETYKDPVFHPSDTDYNIKQEYKEVSSVEISDYAIKVEEWDNDNPVEKSQKVELIQQEHENDPASAYVTFKEESGLVAALATNHEVLDETVVCKRASVKPGKIRVNLPPKLNEMSDDVIKEFFETSYGKIIEFERRKRIKKGKLKSCCWITFEDEKASKYFDKQGHVVFEGVKLDTHAFKEMKTLTPRTSTYELLMSKAQSYPQTNTPLLNSKAEDKLSQEETPQPQVETDDDSVSSMLVQYNQRPIPRPKKKKKIKGHAKKNNIVQNPALVQYPAMAQYQAMAQKLATAQNSAMAHIPAMAQYQAMAPNPAMPHTQYPSMAHYGYGASCDPRVNGYYPNQFGYNYWAQDVNNLNSPYCYYDDAGKLVERRMGRNARMWPY